MLPFFCNILVHRFIRSLPRLSYTLVLGFAVAQPNLRLHPDPSGLLNPNLSGGCPY